jgi:hypothetical protein
VRSTYCFDVGNASSITLAGVAQLVERVALMTAKRSTSRSWVRAPPSAIPISKSKVAAVLLLSVLEVRRESLSLLAINGAVSLLSLIFK